MRTERNQEKPKTVIKDTGYIFESGKHRGEPFRKVMDDDFAYVQNISKKSSNKYVLSTELDLIVKRKAIQKGVQKYSKTERRVFNLDCTKRKVAHETKDVMLAKMSLRDRENMKKYNPCIKQECICYGKYGCGKKPYCDADPKEE